MRRTVNPGFMKVATGLGIWLAVAIAVSALGILYNPPRPVLPALIWGPVIAFLVSFIYFRGLRSWVLWVDLRWPILFHIIRAPIGIAFLLMEAAGSLPAEFAVKAGIGDIVIGVTAIVAMLCVPLRSTIRSGTVLVWNTLGLADILMVVVVAQRLLFFSGNPDSLVELTRFPTLVIPSFVVPMVLITHFVIFAQLWHKRTAGGH